MTYQLIEIDRLERSPQNVRKTESHAALEELKASILAHGLMQNLVVVPAKKGKYQVIAGGRRLEALRALQTEGKLPSDHAVQCQIADGEQAEELSLAENAVRQAMHPADEFEAFAALIGKKQTAAQVAERFGVTERHVLQRMKLGRVAPELLAAYRAGEVTLDALMAFAVTDDHKRQKSIWKSLEGWQENNARVIRQRLTDAMIDADDATAKFVGLEAYKAAGGKVKADLFSEAVYLEDAELLERLANEKLQAEAEKLRAEGWGWVEVENDDSVPSYRCRRIHPKPLNAPAELLAELEQAEQEQRALADEIDAADGDDEEAFDALLEQEKEIESRLEIIEAKIAAHRVFDPEEMKAAGCYVSIDRDGELEIERGLVKPDDSNQEDDENPLRLTSTSAKKEKPEFSQSLLADLKAYRCQAAQAEIATHPEIAFDLLVFQIACGVLDHVSPYDGPDVHFRQSHPRPSVEAKNAATRKLDEIKEGLPVAWLETDDEAERFQAFRKLAGADKHRILAYCTALTLKPDFEVEGAEETAYSGSIDLTHGKVAAYWRPTKDNYLSRISKDQLLAIGKEIHGDRWAHQRKDAKKTAIVDVLHEAFADPDKHGDSAERLKTWMPKGMEFRPLEPEAEPVKQPKKRGKNTA